MSILARFFVQAAAGLAIGATFVSTLAYLNNHFHALATPTFILLMPGVLCGLFAPDASGDFKESVPWGPIASFIVQAVNIGLYSVPAFLTIRFIDTKKSRTD
jgi:hypothetical protein